MDSLMFDIRHGIRALRRGRGLTLAAIVAIGLGIGATVTIFSVVDAVLVRPFPYSGAERLVVFAEEDENRNLTGLPCSAPNFLDWQERSRSFEGIMAFRWGNMNLTGEGEPERISATRVSWSLFQLLGVEPRLGRGFLPEEDRYGNDRVVVLSHAFWERRFGADPGVVGRQVILDGQPHVVTGVMPAHFRFPPWDRAEDLWKPMAFTPHELERRTMQFLGVIGKVRPGLSLDQAQEDMSSVATSLAQDLPETNAGRGVQLTTLRQFVFGDVRPALLVLSGAVGLLLLIACANVANLLLARATARRRETAVRQALGASPPRIVRQHLVESLVLTLAGGVVGVLLAAQGVRLVLAQDPGSVPRLDMAALDGRALAFALLTALVTALLAGLAPAWRLSRARPLESLNQRGSEPPSQYRASEILATAEIALAAVLLIGSALLLRSFLQLRAVDPGFRPAGVLTMRLSLPEAHYGEPHQRARFYQDLLERLRGLPGVTAAGAVTNLPVVNGLWRDSVLVEGRPVARDLDIPLAANGAVTPGYLETMGIPLLRGRTFTDQDTAQAPAVAVISETMAHQFFPHGDPFDHRIRLGGHGDEPWRSIVGIVGDVRRRGLAVPIEPEVYTPHAQGPRASMAVAIRTTATAAPMEDAIRAQVHAVDGNLPVSWILPLETRVAWTISEPRLSMLLVAVFASMASVLAAVGVYAVLSFVVTLRTREIGIRMALGSRPASVVSRFVGRGLVLALTGVAIGSGLAVLLRPLLAGLLYGVSPTDPLTYCAATAALVTIALAACFVPALRASRVDPLQVLRHE